MYVLLVITFLATSALFGDTRNEKFKVFGNCGTCENKIEKAANGLEGVVSADWNKETKEMVVEFDEAKTSLLDIHKAIAGVGYDTDKVKAEDDVYDKLPGCCQYDRSGEESSEHQGHGH